MGHGATSPDRGSQDWQPRPVHRQRSAAGARSRASLGVGRRTCTMARHHGRAHGGGAAYSGGKATALALCGARHPAGRCRALVLKAAGWRMRLCAMPCGAGERSPVSAADLGEGESLPRAHAGLGGGDPRRGEASRGGPRLARGLPSLAVEPWHRGYRRFDAAGRGLVASDRRRCRAGRGAVWGVDLGTSAAQSAVACYHPQTGALACLAAFPAEPTLAERGLRDGVGGLYAECARRGELITLGRHTVHVAALLQAALDRFGRPARIVADRWREADLREALDAAGVPLAALELRGMGFRDGAEDVRGFRKACADRRVVPAPSLLLRSAMAEARTVSDPSANAKLSKGSQGGRRARARDDAAAAILAVAAGVRTPLASRRRWRYGGMAGRAKIADICADTAELRWDGASRSEVRGARHMNFDRWADRVYSESDFGRSIATTAAGVAGLASYLYWNDWVVTACVGIIVFPVGRILASAVHSHWVQSRQQSHSKDQVKELFDNLGREEQDVVQAFVWHGGKFITWSESNRSSYFSSSGIDSLISRDLIHVSVTAYGMREAFVLDTELFEYAQSVLPNFPF